MSHIELKYNNLGKKNRPMTKQQHVSPNHPVRDVETQITYTCTVILRHNYYNLDPVFAGLTIITFYLITKIVESGDGAKKKT